jgi:type IV pilus assembly protein PilY1
VADVWFYSDPADTTKSWDEWRTVLVCGLRKGGNTYFALDITDTLNPKYLWEFPKSTDAATLAIVGQSWSEPVIGRVKIEKGGNLVERWVAFIGGGFDPSEKVDKDATIGKAFFVVDMKTGEIIWQFLYDKNDSIKKWMTHALPASPTAVDTNFDGYVDKVYIGDMGGQMWVFDVSFDESTKKSDSLWAGKRLFTAPKGGSEKHNIYYAPAVAFDKNGIPWVYFGTGDREDPTDYNNEQERFYAVKDDGSGDYPRDEGDLKDVTLDKDNTFAVDTTKKGWYIKLEKSGKQLEKVLAKPTVFNRLLYFTTYTYTQSADLCAVAGISKDYIVEYLSGGGALSVDDLSDLSGTAGARSREIGVGAPSAPVISVNMKGKASVIIMTTSGQIFSQTAFSPTTSREILYWRDVVP